MQVRVEIVPWLTQAFGHLGTSRLVIEKTMAAATLADLLSTLIKEHPKFGSMPSPSTASHRSVPTSVSR
jgi:hypothetical protein